MQVVITLFDTDTETLRRENQRLIEHNNALIGQIMMLEDLLDRYTHELKHGNIVH